MYIPFDVQPDKIWTRITFGKISQVV